MKYVKSKKIVSRVINGEVLILDTENNLIYSLNKSAGYVWNNIQEQPVEKIVCALSKKYDEEEKRILKDVQELIDSLVKNKLVLKKETDNCFRGK